MRRTHIGRETEGLPHNAPTALTVTQKQLRGEGTPCMTRAWSCPSAQPLTYHVRVVVTHVDPLAAREPGLVLEHLLHEAQVACVWVMQQAAGRGTSASTEEAPQLPPPPA